MQDITSKIKAFKNTNVSRYVNGSMVKYEKSIADTEIHNLKSALKDLDREVFKSFLINSDALLDVLNAYESTYVKLQSIQDIANSLKNIVFKLSDGSSDGSYINPAKVDEFRAIINNFSADISTFDTGSRFLVHFEKLSDKKNNKYIFIMSNDLLIVGLVDDHLKKYKLVNAFNYSILKVCCDDDVLRLILPQETYEYFGDKKSLMKIVDIFKELTYNYSDKVFEENEDMQDKQNSIYQYIIFTEQYDKLVDLDCCYEKNLYFYEKDIFLEYIKSVKDKFEVTDFVCDFLLNKYKEAIQTIDKIQPTNPLIDSIFEMFYRFFEQQEDILTEIGAYYKLYQEKIIVLFEDQIKESFKCFESRIFKRRICTKQVEDVLDFIKKKLKFKNLDFSYLIFYFEERKNHHKEMCLEKSKNEILEIVNDMIKRDY